MMKEKEMVKIIKSKLKISIKLNYIFLVFYTSLFPNKPLGLAINIIINSK